MVNQQVTDERKIFQDSVTPLPEEEGLTHEGFLMKRVKPRHRDETMTLFFSLAIAPEKLAELEERVAKGEVLSRAQLQKRYAPPASARKEVVAWLRKQGFKITEISKNGIGVYTKASVDLIEKTLGVTTTRVTKEGITYTAAQNAPSLPASIGNYIHAIIGLQPFRHAQKHNRRVMPSGGNHASLVAAGGAAAALKRSVKGVSKKGTTKKTTSKMSESTPLASPNIPNSPPYMVKEILKAYNADSLSVTGKGQTIAILIDTFPNEADLKAFWKANNLPVTIKQIQGVNVKGGYLPPLESEETLDVEWSSGIAPGATIRVYAAGSLQLPDLDLALDRIISEVPYYPSMRQLSISLGIGELYMAPAEVATQHTKFLWLSALGVNVFISSGDAGSNPDRTGHQATGATQVEYQSSDTNVIAVGGTTLTLTPKGAVQSEVAWSGGGGGKSVLFARPSWQTGVGVPAGNERLVPDVSFAADPTHGCFLVFQGQVIQSGGTSWSAPVWAGFCALINEARLKAKKPPLPFLNTVLYPLLGSSSFRDIDTGTNGAFTAGPGYDLVTGLGVPSVKDLISALTQ